MEVHALHKRGWSISAIARHVGRDRKTVRAYINGDRTPGQRRDDRADPLAPYTAYLAARFVDDPHLWASALYDEIVPLGYPRSYVTFARQLQGHEPCWFRVGWLLDGCPHERHLTLGFPS